MVVEEVGRKAGTISLLLQVVVREEGRVSGCSCRPSTCSWSPWEDDGDAGSWNGSVRRNLSALLAE